LEHIFESFYREKIIFDCNKTIQNELTTLKSSNFEYICNIPCSYHGLCIYDPLNQKCECEKGWKGSDCNTCEEEILCNNRGNCDSLTGKCKKVCFRIF
jgi:hypothetical protein